MPEEFDNDLDLDLEARPELPAPDFDFLIYSLRLQAEMSLGLLPPGEVEEPDFELASHNIDLLAMLREKTKGNLTDDEQLMLDTSLAELRMRLVETRKVLPA